jgi:hypothetical protein
VAVEQVVRVLPVVAGALEVFLPLPVCLFPPVLLTQLLLVQVETAELLQAEPLLGLV